MISKRPNRRSTKSVSEISRLRDTRQRFQRDRPSLGELVAGGEYAEPIAQPELFMMLQLAAALKQARKDKRLTLADVAKRSGIDKAALSRIENGLNVNPTIGTL